MRLVRDKNAARSIGAMAGVVVAVAGGLGAAVGLYSMPDPHNASVGAGSYTQAAEMAVAVATLDNGDILRIEASRGAAHGRAGAGTGPGPLFDVDQTFGTRLRADIRTCDYGCYCDGLGDCAGVYRRWEAFVPDSWFEFSPLLDAAAFSGNVHDCQFDIVWHPEGAIGPFAGHSLAPGSRLDPNGGGIGIAQSTFGAASRTAPADIDMSGGGCFDYSRDAAPGFVTVGFRLEHGGAGAGFDS